jgi:hypothetical protein
MPFYILTRNPQIIRGNMEKWKITHLSHEAKDKKTQVQTMKSEVTLVEIA